MQLASISLQLQNQLAKSCVSYVYCSQQWRTFILCCSYCLVGPQDCFENVPRLCIQSVCLLIVYLLAFIYQTQSLQVLCFWASHRQTSNVVASLNTPPERGFKNSPCSSTSLPLHNVTLTEK